MYFLLVSLSLPLYMSKGCLTLKIIAVLLRLLRWSEVGLVCSSFRSRVPSSSSPSRLRLMPNASKLFAPIVRGRAQYCVANVPSKCPTVHRHLGSFFVGYSPHERTPWQCFRFRGPQAAMACHVLVLGMGMGMSQGPAFASSLLSYLIYEFYCGSHFLCTPQCSALALHVLSL